jgi:hypothetical protein
VACTDENTTLFIRGNVQVTAPSCVARGDSNSVLLGIGTMDVAFTTEYTAALLVGSQLAPRGAKSRLVTESMRLELHGAEVTLSDLEGKVIEPGFSVPGTGFVDPNSSDAPGYGVMFATLIPATVGSRLQSQLRAGGLGASKTVIADVRVFGNTLGGLSIESGSFTYPIRVCYGCSVLFPLEALMADADGKLACIASAQSVPFDICALGQDSMIDCRLCVATHPDVCYSPPG